MESVDTPPEYSKEPLTDNDSEPYPSDDDIPEEEEEDDEEDDDYPEEDLDKVNIRVIPACSVICVCEHSNFLWDQ